jgi:putative redox protein
MSLVSTEAHSGQDHESLRTVAGREVAVGRREVGDAGPHGAGILLDLGECQGCDRTDRADLTVTEARQVARALLAQAAAAEQEAGAEDRPTNRVDVRHVVGDAYAISVRGHAVLVDQPVSAGGQDAAATPAELLIGSLASCVAFYAGRYLVRHGLDRSGLTVTADYAMADDRLARVRAVRLRISLPGGVPAQRRDAMLAVASHCTVHNTLRQEPDVSIELDA